MSAIEGDHGPRAALTFDSNLLHPITNPKLTVLWGHSMGLFWRGPSLWKGGLFHRVWLFQRSVPFLLT